jgi:hypothetical protein
LEKDRKKKSYLLVIVGFEYFEKLPNINFLPLTFYGVRIQGFYASISTQWGLGGNDLLTILEETYGPALASSLW